MKYIIQGHLESSAPTVGLGIFNGKLNEIISIINSKKFIDYLDSNTAVELIDVNIVYIIYSFITYYSNKYVLRLINSKITLKK